MLSKFLESASRLQQVNEEFSQGKLSSFDHSAARETALADALLALGHMHGVQLRAPLFIERGTGEFALQVSVPGQDPMLGVGKFGTLATVLNRHDPRTGVASGARLSEDNGWCWLNHFRAEQLVLDEAQRMRDLHVAVVGSDELVVEVDSTASGVSHPRARSS